MFILRLLGKIIAFPIILILGLCRFVLKIVTNIYSFAAVWLWLFLVACVVWTLVQQQWTQTFLLILIGVVTFLVLFFAVWIEDAMKDLGDYLKKV